MKKKTPVYKKILWIFLSLLITANILVWITGTTYIYKALIYQQPNIDDLDLFPHRTISNTSSAEPWKISSHKNETPLSDTLRKVLEQNQSVAYLVIKNDSVLYEEYWDGYSDSSASNSFSMAKSIVSILVGIAIDEGKIHSVNEPVGNYLPGFGQGEKASITIKDVLNMASGLSFMESYSTPFNNTTDAYYGKNLERLIGSLTVIETPGTINRYKSGDTQVLELLLKKVTGQSISDYASEKLWSRIGAEHDAYWSLDHTDGDEKAYCCFYSNARDFARLGKLYLQNGRWDSAQVVSSEWVQQSLSPNMLPDEHGALTSNYGLQWWIYQDEHVKGFYARGILGQYIVVLPEQNMLLVRLGKKRSEEKINGHPADVVTFIQESVKIF